MDRDRLPADRLIVALDVETLADAERLVDHLQGLVTRFKIGSQLFTAFGPPAVEAVRKRGGEVFLDLCLLYTSPSPRDRQKSRMPSSA